MRPMLGEQKEPANHEEADEDPVMGVQGFMAVE